MMWWWRDIFLGAGSMKWVDVTVLIVDGREVAIDGW